MEKKTICMKYVTEIFVGFNSRFRMYLERFRLSGVSVWFQFEKFQYEG